MTSKLPSYITKNNFGVFIFQYRFQKKVRELQPDIQVLFRRSLHTRSRREAAKRARIWYILMDEITERIITDHECYGRAMALLRRYRQIEHLSWDKAEEFLSELSEGETQLLEGIIRFEAAKAQHSASTPGPSQEAIAQAILQQLYRALNAHPNAGHSLLPSSPNTHHRSDDLAIDELAAKFIEYKQPSITSGTATSSNSKLDLFIKILTEHNNGVTPKVSKLDQAKIRDYRDTLKLIPARRNAFPKNATVNDWIRAGKEPISAKTLKDNTVLIGEFLTWIQDEGYPIERDLKTIFKSIKKPRADQTEVRHPFTSAELKALFESETYQKGLCKSGSDFWAPLIALFTGARMAEILQLHIADVRQEQNIWVFDINTDDEKQVKTDASQRLVPIHSQLIKLGLLDYVNDRGKHSHRLFPEEERSEQGKFRAYSGRFNNWRTKLGIIKADKTKKDFHSFRHTVRTKLTDASVAENLIDDIVGHKSSGASIGKRVYTHTQLVPQKKEAIEKLSYDIDFEKIKLWQKHRLVQLLRNPNLKRAKS